MDTITLGRSDLQVSPICLGTMTFGESQVDEAASHRLLDHALQRGLNFIDTAEMYPVPPSAARYGDTETIIGHWLRKRPDVRSRIVLATKAAGPVRGYQWLRNGSADVTADDIVASCEASLKRLNCEVIDLYQLHWPTRNVPMFGNLYHDPKNDRAGHAHRRAAARPAAPGASRQGAPRRREQRDALGRGRVRAPGRSRRAAAHRQRAERLQPAQPLGGQRPGRADASHAGVAAGLLAAGLRVADGQVRRAWPRPIRPSPDGCRSSPACTSNAGAGPRRWPRRGATTRWRASMA